MSPTTVTQVLTGPQFAAITDFTDLHLEFSANMPVAAVTNPGVGASAGLGVCGFLGTGLVSVVWAASGVGAAAAVSTSATYAGPGDIVSGAYRYCGMRAYTLASIGANAIRLRRDSDNAEQDFVTVTGGGLDLAAISTFKGTANLFITKLYDQVGTNNYTNSTAAKQPALTLSGLGSLPISAYSSASVSTLISSSLVTQAQPFTISAVARRTSNITGTTQVLWANSSSGSLQFSYTTTANTVLMYAGSAVNATATDNVWHAFQGVYGGSSSDINVDGTVNTVGAGSQAQVGQLSYIGSYDNTSYGMDGNIQEFGEWAFAFTPTQSSNMSANQHAYWGF